MRTPQLVRKGLVMSGFMLPVCTASTALPEPAPGLQALTAGPIGDNILAAVQRGAGTTPIWHARGPAAGAEYGYSVATAGDVNGDGYSDVIVGARHYSNGQSYGGAAYLYLGSADGLGTSPAWFVESNQSGAAFVYLGSPAGPAATPVWTGQANQSGAQYGLYVATAGGRDGDG